MAHMLYSTAIWAPDFGGHDALSHIPGFCFLAELVAATAPNLKLVLFSSPQAVATCSPKSKLLKYSRST